MACLRCSAERIASGSGLVLPALRRRLPLSRVSSKWRSLVMPGVLAGTVFLVFHDSRVMIALVPAWLLVAWRLGSSGHEQHVEGDDDEGQEGPEDSTGDRFQQQAVEERKEPASVSRWSEEGEEVSGHPEVCPACDSDLAYEIDGRAYSDCVSVEIPGVYDGGLFWRCPFCSYDWHKWHDPAMRKKAEPYMNQPMSST